ncbi:MAG: stage V sporulation protein AE [Ruminococcus sp.]|jgi:stage V sporulation protein AE|nr:stage V sporulation protein AE [Ruminococcus sp.]
MIVEIIKAFIIGGAICAVGQLFIDYTRLTPARILTGFVVAGVILSALGLYKPIVEFAGAGATVPLTGFGHLLAEGIKKSIAEKGLLGILTGGLTAASGGVTAAIVFGLIAAICFKQRDKS